MGVQRCVDNDICRCFCVLTKDLFHLKIWILKVLYDDRPWIAEEICFYRQRDQMIMGVRIWHHTIRIVQLALKY